MIVNYLASTYFKLENGIIKYFSVGYENAYIGLDHHCNKNNKTDKTKIVFHWRQTLSQSKI